MCAKKMDFSVSCPDMSLCFVPFFRKKNSKKNKSKVYNVEKGTSGKLEASEKTETTKMEDSTYVKYEKYRPSIQEENVNLATSAEHTKANRNNHHKLPNNLSKSLTKPQPSFDFIDQLEENSKKIENIFSKCKGPSASSTKSYENIENAFRIFLLNDVECDVSSLMNDVDRRKLQENISKSLSAHKFETPQDFENIKKALQIMFGDRDFTKASNERTSNAAAPKSDVAAPQSSAPSTPSKEEIKMAADAKLQSLVDDVLRLEFQKHLRESRKLKAGRSISHLTSLHENCSSNDDNGDCHQSTESIEKAVDTCNEKDELDVEEEHLRKKKRLKKQVPKKPESVKSSSSEAEMDNRINRNRRNTVNTESSVKYGSSRASMDHLDEILLQMRDVSERRKELEKEQNETMVSLREKQNELQWRSNCSASEKVKICETIEALQSKIRELEKKLELQNVHHEELLLEMAAIKRSSQQRTSLPGIYNTSSWKKPAASNQEVQTSPESNASELTYLDRLTPSTSNSYDSGNIYESRHGTYRSRQHAHGCLSSVAPSSSFVDLHHASLDPSARYSINTNNAVACKPYWTQSEPTCTCPVNSDQELPSATPSNESACSDDSGIQNVSVPHSSASITVDIDKIMAKIDQDNRILAELDKTRSTIATQGSMTAEQLRNISEMGIIPPASCQSVIQMQQSTLPPSSSQTALNPPISLTNTFPGYLPQFDISGTLRPSIGSMLPTQLQQLTHAPVSQSTFSILQPGFQTNFSQIPNFLQSQFDLDVRKNGNLPGSNFASCSDLLLPHEDLMIESAVRRSQDLVEIPGKGLCNVFISKYSYDPFSQSTSVCPEAELAINAGDYILVYGEPDDDGYVDAELMDGRRGLVPIIFIQRLSGDELLEFKQRVMAGMKECDDSASTTIPHDIETINADENSRKFRPEYNIGGLTEEEEDEDADESESVPAPKQLTLERQLNKSILIRWNAPENSPSHCIDSYHVYVDGVLKTTIKANERTKALLEGVDSTKPHRISVRSVTQNRRTSRDAACTMLIGKDIPSYPTNVRAHHVTATSAVISWMPSNSNFQHTVCVNNVEVRTVKPGVYRHTITGLVPNTIYRVTVRAKNIRAPQFDDKTASDKFASHIDFRTLPKGMPDPPAEIQVEVGPQDGTLLVTWVPVTAESSNGAPITGYAVYADGKKVTDIDSPTGDHALIDISKIISMNPRHVTVRTKSKENQSCDSNATPIPPSAMKGKHHSSKQSGNYNRHPTRNAYGQVIIDPEENLSDKEVYPGQVTGVPSIAEITKDNPTDDNYSEEEFLEAHRSNRNIRYQHPMQPRSHGDPRVHMERVRPSSNAPHDRNSSRPFDRRGYDPRRDNREYHHSPARQGERRRVTDVHGMRVVRGPSTAASAAAHRQHAASSAVPPEDKSRIVVALFDYDPPNMSPNPETCHEELSFVEGDQIRILSGKDPDGFYWGECRGKQGYVPENMITDIENAPKTILDKLNKKRNKYIDIRHSADARKMIALYDYDPHEHSPHSDNGAELSFSEGQIIFVKGQPDNDGFYLGEVDGMQGLVPSNYLQPVDDFPEDAGPHHSGQGNRNVIRPAGQRDRNRGHGPGARGPPPPPRDGMPPRGDPRDRRKDPHSLYENQQDQLRNQARIDESRHPERKIGRELPNFQPDHYANISRENNTSAVTSMPNSDPNRASFRTNRLRGAPNMPELAVNSKPPPATHAGIGLKFPESPNLMQKLSEMTGGHASENPVDNILSKGKELIFMKFGLGK